MKCSSSIVSRPYIPYNRPEDFKKPYICRLAPFATGFTFEWFDNFAKAAKHELFYKKRGSEKFESKALESAVYTVDGLDEDCEYEFKVVCENGYESNTRLVRTAENPENTTVVNYLHPEDTQYIFSGKYLCSPSLARLESGKLIAGMDVFGQNMPQDLVILFSSDDNGKSWKYLCDIHPFYWACLFVHKGVLYIFGLTTEYGNLQIAASYDEGKTFTKPTVILYGSNLLCANGGVHRAPMQIVAHGGRLYTSCEYGSWTLGEHLPGVLSIDENADLLTAENWHISGFLPYDGKMKEETVQRGDSIEGNIVKMPDGKLYNILRWKRGKALALEIDTENPDALPKYSREIEMPVTTSMFRILPYKDGYLLVTNHKTPKTEVSVPSPYRNVLSAYFTKDFESYTLLKDIVNKEDISDREVGFQYPAVLSEGDRLYVEIRAAYNHADNFHNSNYALFAEVNLDE